MTMLVCAFLVLQLPFALGGIATVWERFWNVSCQYSSPVSREKRSYFEEPDFSEPEELFKYLYPLAHLKAEDFRNEGQQRSGYRSHSFSGWMLDIIDFWQYECHIRYRAEENTDDEEDFEDDDEETVEYDFGMSSTNQMPFVGNGSFGNSSSLQGGKRFPGVRVRERRSSRVSRVHGTNFSLINGTGNRRMVSYDEQSSGLGNGNGGGDAEANFERPRARKKIKKRKRKPSKDAQAETASKTTTEAPPPAASKAEPEAFFSSYGGDIEYFFPLISFGIPFDGEITFLGFHGFKGLFPYR